MKVQRIGEFSNPDVPINEIESFLGINIDDISESTFPYAWSNSVTSLDGVLHFGSQDSDVGDIALKRVAQVGNWSSADFRLLQAGWTYADGVLISAENIRNEPDADCRIVFEDLLEFRQARLERQRKQPVQIIVSIQCDFPLDRPMFRNSATTIWVFTTTSGANALEATLGKNASKVAANIRVFSSLDSTQLDFKWVFKRLKEEGIHFLDVTAGGKVIHQLISCKLLQETRMTVAGHLAGCLGMTGDQRPNLFGLNSRTAYTPQTSPLFSVYSMRLAGDHHWFIRGKWSYRH